MVLALENDLSFSPFNAEQAFKWLKLDIDIYVRMQPECGFMSGGVVLLSKYLHELKQTASKQHKLLVSTLREPSVPRLRDSLSGELNMVLAVHVDHIIVAGSKKVTQ